MALDLVSFTPVDGAVNWSLNTDLTMTFNAPVSKGQGNIHVVQDTTGKLGVVVDVNSPNVTINDRTVTVDLPSDLLAGNGYTILIDSGAFIDSSQPATPSATLLTQDFELLPLLPFTTQGGGDGTDYTLIPPLNYSIDNSKMSPGGTPEWNGWSFADKGSWVRQAGDQARSSFTLGTGTIAVGDPDEYEDALSGAALNSTLATRSIKLNGVAPNSVVLEFDSSFRPENVRADPAETQVGTLDVRFDGGAWVNLLTLDPTNTSNTPPSPTFTNKNINEHLVSGVNTGVSTDGKGNVPFAAIANQAGANIMEVRFGVKGLNTYWWGIDNLKVTGQIAGAVFNGITSPTVWNLDLPRFTTSIDKTSMSENGGTATGTVTRNGSTAAELVVTLSSNDLTEATVPASVTIPVGATSANFTISAVNDTLSDRTQTVLISASAPGFSPANSSIQVTDDEGPKIVTLTPADNAVGVSYTGNLSVQFDTNVKRGSGNIHILRSSDNFLVSSIDVATATFAPNSDTVIIDPPVNLLGFTEYYILIDDGAILDTSATVTTNAVLLSQNFELSNLGPFISRTSVDGTDFTKSLPQGFAVNNAGIVGGSPSADFYGWNFVDKNSWIATSGNGGRGDFVLGQGTVAVADPSLLPGVTDFNGFLQTKPVDLNGVNAGSVSLEFDYAFRSGLPRVGVVQVSYNGGAWTDFLQFSSDVPSSRIVVNNTGIVSGVGGTLLGPLNNPNTGNMRFQFGVVTSGESGFLAIDNIKISGAVTGVPFQGISDRNVWSFTTSPDDDLPIPISFSPVDNATSVAVGSNLVVTFDQSVRKGNGFVHLVRTSDGKLGHSIDVQSASVTVAGAVVTIDPPLDLLGLNNYFVQFDSGSILSSATTATRGAILLSEDFELLPLGPAVLETVGVDGTDFTTVPPSGFSVDNSQMPPGGVPEWNGWTFVSKDFWTTQGGQSRANFTRGSGTIAVGEVDEWDDVSTLNNSFNSLFLTSPINLTNVAASSVVLEFDSSFRPEDSAIANNQVGMIDVSYDGGTSWSNLLKLDRSNTSGVAEASNVNERRVLGVPNPTAGNMRFRFGVTGTNDYWWAIDNILVKGDVSALPYLGNVDPTTWNFGTAEAATLSVAVSPASISENGGSTTGTVTRNLGTTGAVIVTLTSNDSNLATIPATVTIPDGQASATFPITAIDDSRFDGLKNLRITASGTGFVNGIATVPISDNETGEIIFSEIMFNPGSGNGNGGYNDVRREWVEIYNRGTTTADLGGWTLDDEDTNVWGVIPAGTLLAPGGVAVIYNSFFASNTDAMVRTDWAIPASASVIGLFWGLLANDPSAVAPNNEILVLRDAGASVIEQVNFDDAGTWPQGVVEGRSIFLKNVSLNNDDGGNWARSVSGSNGAIAATGTVYTPTVVDVGSPGSIQVGGIATRGVYYHNSSGNAGNAIASDKSALLPGQSSTFANYTNYSRGLNGVLVDIQGLPASTTEAQLLANIVLTQWDGISAAGFTALPAVAVPTLALSASGGVAGSAQVRISFPDNSLQNTWLRVEVLSNAITGLPSRDVFYFGNVIGDLNVGNTSDRLRVNAIDTGAVRNNQSTEPDSAQVTNIYDLNRDGRVNALDTAIVRNNQQTEGIVAPIVAPIGRGALGSGGLNNRMAPAAFSKLTQPVSENRTSPNPEEIGNDTLSIPSSRIVESVVARNSIVLSKASLFQNVEMKSKPKEEASLTAIDDFFASLKSSI